MGEAFRSSWRAFLAFSTCTVCLSGQTETEAAQTAVVAWHKAAALISSCYFSLNRFGDTVPGWCLERKAYTLPDNP